MDNLKLAIIGAVFIVVAIGGIVYFERNLGVQRLVWVGPPFVIFLVFVIFPKWGSYEKPHKIMATLLLAPSILLVGSVLINTYVWEFFEYSRIYIFVAMVPFLIYGAWYTLTLNRK